MFLYVYMCMCVYVFCVYVCCVQDFMQGVGRRGQSSLPPEFPIIIQLNDGSMVCECNKFKCSDQKWCGLNGKVQLLLLYGL